MDKAQLKRMFLDTAKLPADKKGELHETISGVNGFSLLLTTLNLLSAL